MPIITSLLDVDYYKLLMGDLFFNHFGDATGTYEMRVRNYDKINYGYFVESSAFRDELSSLGDLKLTQEEAEYLRSLKMFSESYIQFLIKGPFNPDKELTLGFDTRLPVVNGKLATASLYETFCLAIGNEIYAKTWAQRNDIKMASLLDTAVSRLISKIEKFDDYVERRNLNLVEFGTRRRLSAEWQETVFMNIVTRTQGTSNVNLSRLNGLTPRGTQAHEYYMAGQAFYPIQDSQKQMMKIWLSYFNGKNAIALTDTFGIDKFLIDFDSSLASAYSGVRHDSGSPFDWGRKMIKLYNAYGINPMTKTLMFTNGLNFEQMFAISDEFASQTNVSFGIGTDLTNDTFSPVPQAVMKMSVCNGQPVAKLSDDPEKATCGCPEYLAYIKWVAQNL